MESNEIRRIQKQIWEKIMEIKLSDLSKCTGLAIESSAKWFPFINEILNEKGINNKFRICAFISQMTHESGFKPISENLNYASLALRQLFKNHFTEEEATNYHRQPERIANKLYGNRMGNGPEESGDGWRYRGRGLIQITGKDNYIACGKSLGLDLTIDPDLLLQYKPALLSACWYWNSRKLNELADNQDIVSITKKINGGIIGLEHRQKLYQKCIEVFS